MKSKPFSGFIFSGLPYMVLFTGMFAWFAFISGYILFFQEKSSLFLFSGVYITEKLWQPGGLLYLLSGFLTSFYYHPVAGSIIISGLITLTTLVISRCIVNISGRNEKIYPFVIGLLMFLLHTEYTILLQASLGIFLQVSAFSIIVKMAKKSMWWVAFILTPLNYLVAGGFCWILMFVTTLYLVISERKLLLVRICSLWGMMFFIFLVSRKFIFFSSDTTLLFFPIQLPDDSLARMIFLVISALIVILPVIAVVRFPVPNFLSATYHSENWIRAIVVLAVLLMMGVYRYDKKNVHYFHAEKLFYEGKYDELIEYSTRIPSTNTLTLFFTNIALAEKGILNDRLFGFLQSPEGKTLFLKWEMIREILKRGGYFYYTTGMINEAHRWAYENMVMTGHTPEGLKMLIRTELINGNYRMASKYISLLKKTLFYRKDAQHFEKFLFNDDAVEKDADLGEKRKIRIRADFFSITDDPYINIERVSYTDSLNRAAFNYKIAYLLLKKDYKTLSANLPRFAELGYKVFPTHVEEAILAISTMNNGENPYRGNLRVSRLTEERWTQFLTVFQQYGNDPRKAEPALRKQFGNTFWYWAFYR
ncbi:MAG TPA: DUF6057 family protein [Bacteroidales bacterium]|nr:DUF6057 family protein [Bacteroidales bacterium]